jgi:hypothetical protein
MYEKSGKFYADWRDRTGARKRKSFRTARAALLFEREQKELAHPKPKAKGTLSPASFSLSTLGRRHTPTMRARPAQSSPKLEVCHRTGSAPRTSQTLTTRSRTALTLTERKSTRRTH